MFQDQHVTKTGLRGLPVDALLKAVTVVLPVMAVLALGNLFARFRSFTSEAKGIGALVFWLCLPALVWRDVARSDPLKLFDARLCLGVVAVLIVIGVLAYRYARWRKAPNPQVGVIAQAIFRSNMLYVGLPVLLYHVRSMQADEAKAAGLAAVTVAVAIPVLNAGSVLFLLLARRHEPGRQASAWRMVQVVFTNPLIVGVIAGLLFAIIPGAQAWLMPKTLLGNTLDLVSGAALPLALFSVGAMLDPRRAWSSWRSSALVAIGKLLVMPALGLATLWHLGVRDVPLAVGIILLACPTAAVSHAMALEMGGDEALASDLVAVTTLVCPLTLVAWLTLLQSLQTVITV